MAAESTYLKNKETKNDVRKIRKQMTSKMPHLLALAHKSGLKGTKFQIIGCQGMNIKRAFIEKTAAKWLPFVGLSISKSNGAKRREFWFSSLWNERRSVQFDETFHVWTTFFKQKYWAQEKKFLSILISNYLYHSQYIKAKCKSTVLNWSYLIIIIIKERYRVTYTHIKR